MESFQFIKLVFASFQFVDSYIGNGQHLFTNNSFSFLFSYTGGAYFLLSSTTFAAAFRDNRYRNMFSNSGSVMNTWFSMSLLSDSALLTFTNESISSQFNKNYGSLYFSPNSNIQNSMISNSSFTNCYGNSGAAIMMSNAGTLNCSFCIFENDYDLSLNQSAFIEKLFTDFGGKTSDFIDTDNLKLLVLNLVGQGYVQLLNSYNQVEGSSVDYSVMSNCIFKRLKGVKGSAIYLSNSKLMVSNENQSGEFRFEGNEADSGTIYAVQNSQVVLVNVSIVNNSGRLGSFLFLQQSNCSIETSSIQNNTASSKGTFYIFDLGFLTCDSCLVKNNYATDSSIVFAFNNYDSLVLFNNSDLLSNRADTNSITLLYSSINILNSLIMNNIAARVNHGATLINSQMVCFNTSITYTDPLFLQNSLISVESGFFNLNFQSTLNLSDSEVSFCKGKLAILEAYGGSSVFINGGSGFLNNQSPSGSVLYLSSTSEVLIQDAVFADNVDLNIYLTTASISISNSLFQNSRNSYIQGFQSNISVSQTQFKNSSNSHQTGLAIQCTCLILSISDCSFQNLSAAQGGALYLTPLPASNFTVFITFTYIQIQNSHFSSNQALQGGSIYLNSINTLLLQNNTFTGSEARALEPLDQYSTELSKNGMGGAIYFGCLANQGWLCLLNLVNGNSFEENSASSEGGAIAWVNVRYASDGTNQFVANTAFYGNDVSSFAKQLLVEFITSNDKSLNSSSSSSLRSLSSSSTDPIEFNIVSGTIFTFKATILDQDLNVYNIQSSAKATLSLVNSTSSTIISGNQVQAADGVFLFNQILIIAVPGSEVQLSLSVTSLESYNNEISFLTSPLQIRAKARECVSGEEQTIDFQCKICTYGYYLYKAPTNFTSCKQCNPLSQCFSGNQVAPIDGYWRPNSTSEVFVKCPRSESCLKGNLSMPMGVCATGYEGILCAQCQRGFTKSGNYECKACPLRWKNILKLSGVLFFGILVVSFLVRSTLMSANRKKPIYSVYVKILTNHIQILGIIGSIDFSWPSEIQAIQNSQSQVASVTEEIFSFDCFLLGANELDDGRIRLYYKKLILYMCLPVVLSLFAVGYWLVVSACRKDFYSLKNQLISTIVILLFLIHPNVANMVFSTFNCMDVVGTNRLIADFTQVCFQGTHLVYATGVALIGVVFWAIGIPLFALILLLKHKIVIVQLENQSVQSKADRWKITQIRSQYGFLFNGYKIEFFYWEIFIIYRKVAFVMVTVFLSSVSAAVQVLVALIIVILAIIIQQKTNPYYTETLNRMENYSLIVSAVTLYAGMYYITGKGTSYIENNGVKWFFLVAIVTPNLVFLGYFAWNMRTEILKEALIRSPKAFKILTLGLMDIGKFKRTYMQQEEAFEEDRLEPVHSLDQIGRPSIYEIPNNSFEVSVDESFTQHQKLSQDHHTKSNFMNTVFDEQINDLSQIAELKQKGFDLLEHQSRFKLNLRGEKGDIVSPNQVQMQVFDSARSARSQKVFPEGVLSFREQLSGRGPNKIMPRGGGKAQLNFRVLNLLSKQKTIDENVDSVSQEEQSEERVVHNTFIVQKQVEKQNQLIEKKIGKFLDIPHSQLGVSFNQPCIDPKNDKPFLNASKQFLPSMLPNQEILSVSDDPPLQSEAVESFESQRKEIHTSQATFEDPRVDDLPSFLAEQSLKSVELEKSSGQNLSDEISNGSERGISSNKLKKKLVFENTIRNINLGLGSVEEEEKNADMNQSSPPFA